MSLDIDLYFEIQTGNIQNEYVVFSTNITHNLNRMADKASMYKALWYLTKAEDDFYPRVDRDISITLAKELLIYLEHGLNQLKTYPEFFKQFSASNGWGTYEQFIPWIEKLIEACKQYPDALLRVSI
jgi:hypothetical protein